MFIGIQIEMDLILSDIIFIAKDMNIFYKTDNLFYCNNFCLFYFSFQILICLKAGSEWRKFFFSWWDLSTSGIFGGIFVSFSKIAEL